MNTDLNKKDKNPPWDDNLPKNKEYIQKFYKKSEREIKQQENEGKVGITDMGNNSKIIKIKKNPNGDITDVMLENGNVFTINEAIMLAKDGIIKGVNVGTAKNGREYLRSNPNEVEGDNLDNSPIF
jgi:hypothetical protein